MGNKMQFEAVACRLFLHYSYTLAQKASNYGIFCFYYRVLRKRGELYFISSFGIDKIAVEATLLPMLKKQKIYFSLSQTKNFIIVQIGA
jgi:hypothetical protein